MEDFKAIKERYSQSESSDSVTGPTMMPDKKVMMAEAAGGFKKGRIYGMGSESSRLRLQYNQSSYRGTSSSTSLVDLKMLEQRIQEKLHCELEKKDKEMEMERRKMQKTMQKKDKKISTLIDMNRLVIQHLGLQVPTLPTEFDSDFDDDDGENVGPLHLLVIVRYVMILSVVL